MHPPARRPRLTPAMADVRRAVRELLAEVLPASVPAVPEQPQAPDTQPGAVGTEAPQAPDARLVLIALSGGPDSLALAAALAFEAPRAGLSAGAGVLRH